MAALRLYQLIIFLAAPFIRLSLSRRVRRGREDPVRMREKFGHAAVKRPTGHLIWVHAASVGEVNSVLPLLGDILTGRPAQHILLTSGTVTSAQTVARWQSQNPTLQPRLSHQYAPLDRTAYVRRFLNHWQPDAAFWVESEIWPNAVLACRARNIPLVMLNGRLSAKSFAGWQRFQATARHLLGSFTLLMAQDKTTAERLLALGITEVKTPGNLKLDAPPLTAEADKLSALETQLADRPCFLAASTHPGEEEQIAEALKLVRAGVTDVLAIIAPRHPDRGDAIAAALRAAGFAVAQRSQDEPVSTATEIYLADTLGELGLFYRRAPIVLMGGTLVPHGGQNPMEAAQLDCALLHGPHIDNFTEIFAALTAQQACAEVSDAATLASQVIALMQNPKAVTQLAEAAASCATTMGGARHRAIALLEDYLVDPKATRPTGPALEAHDG
ncbi:MAG: 3-deoxy-D-manno-octulosonic acid transferase [Parvibaculales bacterium]